MHNETLNDCCKRFFQYFECFKERLLELRPAPKRKFYIATTHYFFTWNSLSVLYWMVILIQVYHISCILNHLI